MYIYLAMEFDQEIGSPKKYLMVILAPSNNTKARSRIVRKALLIDLIFSRIRLNASSAVFLFFSWALTKSHHKGLFLFDFSKTFDSSRFGSI